MAFSVFRALITVVFLINCQPIWAGQKCSDAMEKIVNPAPIGYEASRSRLARIVEDFMAPISGDYRFEPKQHLIDLSDVVKNVLRPVWKAGKLRLSNGLYKLMSGWERSALTTHRVLDVRKRLSFSQQKEMMDKLVVGLAVSYQLDGQMGYWGLLENLNGPMGRLQWRERRYTELLTGKELARAKLMLFPLKMQGEDSHFGFDPNVRVSPEIRQKKRALDLPNLEFQHQIEYSFHGHGDTVVKRSNFVGQRLELVQEFEPLSNGDKLIHLSLKTRYALQENAIVVSARTVTVRLTDNSTLSTEFLKKRLSLKRHPTDSDLDKFLLQILPQNMKLDFTGLERGRVFLRRRLMAQVVEPRGVYKDLRYGRNQSRDIKNPKIIGYLKLDREVPLGSVPVNLKTLENSLSELLETELLNPNGNVPGTLKVSIDTIGENSERVKAFGDFVEGYLQ